MAAVGAPRRTVSTVGRALGAASGLVQFFPLSVLAAYAFRHGAPTNERFIQAFELAAAAAVVQLALLLPRRRPTNRLILGANLYLLAGGAAALGRQWWLLQTYGALGESAIFLCVLAVGVVTTFGTASGFVAAEGAPRDAVRRASLWLLVATLAAVLVAVAFRGDRTWAAVAPVVALAVLQRILKARLAAPAAPLAARVYEAPGDPVVVAVHGSSGRGRYFHPLATALSERAHASVTSPATSGRSASRCWCWWASATNRSTPTDMSPS